MIAVEIQTNNWKRKFFLLWSGQAVSIFTSSVIHMAIVWYLTDTTGSAAILSLATMVGFLPQAILGPFIGVLIDRYNRKIIMILSDIFIAMVTMILIIAGFVGEPPIWLIMVILFLRSVGSTFHNPSIQAVTPLIVPKDNLTACAGYSQTFESVSLIFSPAISAILYGVLDINIILFVDIIGAIFAVITTSLVKIPSLEKTETPSIENAETIKKTDILREAKEGFTALRSVPGMLSLMFISVLYAMIYFPIGTLYPLITMSYFGGSVGDSSLIEISSSVGVLLGSLALGRIGDKLNKIGAIKKSIAGMGIGLIATGLLPTSGLKAFFVLAFLMGITIPFYHGVLSSIYQTNISPVYLGRVFSLTSSVRMIAMPLGLILSGTFAEIIGVNIWYLISGILSVVIAIVCALLPSLRKQSKRKV